jgi:hypothetical protein
LVDHDLVDKQQSFDRPLLVPGQRLVISLKDPQTRVVLLPAGTILTPGLIATLGRAGLDSYTALCIGDEVEDSPQDPVAETVVDIPQLRAFERVQRSSWTLRNLLTGLLAIVAGIYLVGHDPAALDLGAGIAICLILSFTHSWQATGSTRRKIVAMHRESRPLLEALRTARSA